MKIIEGPCESYEKLSEKYKIGKLDVEGRTVLDVGADWGSTTCIFVNNGASQVISVESDSKRSEEFRKNFKNIENVKLIELGIDSVKNWRSLIEEYNPGVAQIDCEGCEKTLISLNDEIFSKVSEYHVECHSPDVLSEFLEKFSRNDFQVREIMDCENNPRVKMVWARK